MKQTLVTILRDYRTGQTDFRIATEKLASLLAVETSAYLAKEENTVQTPVGSATGYRFKNKVVLVLILRSGLALLYPFMHFYPDVKVGFIGMRRDEVTAEPQNYYHNLPSIAPKDDVIVLEPMLATGGSLSVSIRILLEHGVPEEKIIIANVVAAPEGIKVITENFPKLRLIIAQTDERLNERKFIVPGLGDFGDRYFGTIL